LYIFSWEAPLVRNILRQGAQPFPPSKPNYDDFILDCPPCECIFIVLGISMPNKAMPTHCPCIPMQWTEQGPLPLTAAPWGLNQIRIYGYGVGMSLFSLRCSNISSLHVFFEETGPLATTLIATIPHLIHSGPFIYRHKRSNTIIT